MQKSEKKAEEIIFMTFTKKKKYETSTSVRNYIFFSEHEEHTVQNLLITAQGIYGAKSTNLNKVKDELGRILENAETTKPESNYQRLIRFFGASETEKESLIKSLLCISFCVLNGKSSKPKYLTLDGTSWEYGEKKIHLLTLGIVITGISIPIWWEELDKKGTSNFKERKSVMETACGLYNLQGLILLADREYIGEEWFKYLKNKGLGFVIRIKKGVYKDYIDTQRVGFDKHFKHQKWRYRGLEVEAKKKTYKNCGVAKQVEILGEKYTFVVFKNPKEDAEEPLVYFLSTLKKKVQVVKAYPIRWSIETCFKHLKSNGFDLEALNFKNPSKIKMMLGIVVFLYAICIGQGWLQYRTFKKSDWKKYKDGTITLAISVFRKGVSYLAIKMINLKTFIRFLTQSLKMSFKPFWVKTQLIDNQLVKT